MTKIVKPEKARQGKRGGQVLVVLVVALALAAIVWIGVEMYGQDIEPANSQQVDTVD
ncbi:hypothetical protein ABFT80_03840 [Mesorhizobium sp. SB112]|uniref:hypothetical protein n=1 Tax=Mesorhizobium sp. SB112 TaxID=3151853 RepID=UPI0032631968